VQLSRSGGDLPSCSLKKISFHTSSTAGRDVPLKKRGKNRTLSKYPIQKFFSMAEKE
jgi:hypothetical protein